MDNQTGSVSKRERRREKKRKCELEETKDNVIKQNKIASKDSKTSEMNSGILVRRETFTVLEQGTLFKSTFLSEKDKSHDDSKDEISIGGSEFDPQSDSDDAKAMTQTINGETWKTESGNRTYEVNNERCLPKNETCSVQWDMVKSDCPVPAPRRGQTISAKEQDRNSSDTDKDVMEIEVDERNTSNRTESSEQQPQAIMKFEYDTSVEEPPKPKPRKLSTISAVFPRTDSISKSKSLEEITVKVISPWSPKSDSQTKPVDYSKSANEKPPKVVEKKCGKNRRFAAILQQRKEQKGSVFSSVMKLEKTRIPTITSILRDMKEDSTRGKLEEEDGIDFEIDSPRLPQSLQNDKMYVQCKNGFYLTNREDIFKRVEDFLTGDNEGGIMGDSEKSNMLKTGMFFQKYWSRLMMCIHGVLAGLGIGHAFAVSAILYYFNTYEKFIDIYACLALKIHFIFYTLIALSMISSLDRLDVGHTSKKHWQKICSNFPISWFILTSYAVSFFLTFANHNAEFRFDSHQHGNETEETLLDAEIHDDMTGVFSCWYRIVWARDVIVLSAWLLITLTEYQDNLYIYVQDVASQSDSNDRKLRLAIS